MGLDCTILSCSTRLSVGKFDALGESAAVGNLEIHKASSPHNTIIDTRIIVRVEKSAHRESGIFCRSSSFNLSLGIVASIASSHIAGPSVVPLIHGRVRICINGLNRHPVILACLHLER
jgi:hypothetical protein